MKRLNEEEKKRIVELEELVAEYEEKMEVISPKLRIAKGRYENLKSQSRSLWDKKRFYEREIEDITKPKEPEYLSSDEHPDKENLVRISMICQSLYRAHSIYFMPVNEIKWKVKEHVVDIEMPADPIDRGDIIFKEGRYHCFNKKKERLVKALDIFYGKTEDEKYSKYLFNGEHKGYE